MSLYLSLSLGNKEALLYLAVSVTLCLTTVQSLFSAAPPAWGEWRERLKVGETGGETENGNVSLQ